VEGKLKLPQQQVLNEGDSENPLAGGIAGIKWRGKPSVGSK